MTEFISPVFMENENASLLTCLLPPALLQRSVSFARRNPDHVPPLLTWLPAALRTRAWRSPGLGIPHPACLALPPPVASSPRTSLTCCAQPCSITAAPRSGCTLSCSGILVLAVPLPATDPPSTLSGWFLLISQGWLR